MCSDLFLQISLVFWWMYEMIKFLNPLQVYIKRKSVICLLSLWGVNRPTSSLVKHSASLWKTVTLFFGLGQREYQSLYKQFLHMFTILQQDSKEWDLLNIIKWTGTYKWASSAHHWSSLSLPNSEQFSHASLNQRGILKKQKDLLQRLMHVRVLWC